MTSAWIDYSTFYLSTHPQQSQGWKEARSERLTASNFGHLVVPKYKNQQQLADDLLCARTETFSEDALERMRHGTVTEDPARDWYSTVTNDATTSWYATNADNSARQWYSTTYKVPVIQVGLAVPKWCQQIGGSPDGLVGTDGLIEIKCPKIMYWSLTYKIQGKPLETGASFGIPAHLTPKMKEGEYDTCPVYLKYPHIPITHYAQMQGNLAIFGRKWCDYIVYATDSGQAYVERVMYDHDFWIDLYGRIQAFLSRVVPARRAELIKQGKLLVLPS